MSLRPNAVQERKWGKFPALRKILEGKELPHRYYGNSSISDNVFEKINRLIEISFLVQENESEVLKRQEDKKLIQDLSQLENELRSMEEILTQGRNHLRRIMG